MSRIKLIYLAKIIIFFIIYFVTAKFGLNLQAVSRFATLVWIPTGLSLAVLLLYGKKYWPGIALGAFFVNLSTGAPPLVALGIAIGNTLEALVGFYILTIFFDFISNLSRLKDVLRLVLIAAPIAATVSATVGVTSLLLGGVITSSVYFTTWVPWWVGDVISIFIITPVILLWSHGISIRQKPSRVVEFVELLLIVIAVGFFIFNSSIRFPVIDQSIIYLVYPPIIWAALRFGQREVAAILLIFSGLAIWDTMLGFGPFAYKDVNVSLLNLQFFMIITSLTTLILAVVVAERRALEERKDDFISMASHELRTPVTSLKLYAEIVRTKLTTTNNITAKKYLGKLDDQIYKLTALVLELLDVTRIQSGKLQINRKPFNLNLLIAETVEAMQKTTKSHSIQVKGKFKGDVYADKERIYQVLVNLLGNAIKYSPDGGKIIVHCRSKKSSIQISIEDNGIGIGKDHLRRIFEKLYQAPRNKANVFHGLGIGLFVSAEIIKMHKGKIWAESKDRKGSIFHFVLPIIADAYDII